MVGGSACGGSISLPLSLLPLSLPKGHAWDREQNQVFSARLPCLPERFVSLCENQPAACQDSQPRRALVLDERLVSPLSELGHRIVAIQSFVVEPRHYSDRPRSMRMSESFNRVLELRVEHKTPHILPALRLAGSECFPSKGRRAFSDLRCSIWRGSASQADGSTR